MASAKFKMIKIWARKGFWDKDMIEEAVKKGWLTEEEKKEIFKEVFGIEE